MYARQTNFKNYQNKIFIGTEQIIWTAETHMYTCQTNYTNCPNKYVYLSNKFYKLPKQTFVLSKNYMNRRNKYCRGSVTAG
jgi:hypothetical protein